MPTASDSLVVNDLSVSSVSQLPLVVSTKFKLLSLLAVLSGTVFSGNVVHAQMVCDGTIYAAGSYASGSRSPVVCDTSSTVSSTFLIIGDQAGDTASLSLSGGSTWQPQSVNSGTLIVGNLAGSAGVVNLEGLGTRLKVHQVSIGSAGSGTVSINGATFTVTGNMALGGAQTVLPLGENGVGSMRVSDNGSVNIAGFLVVGYSHANGNASTLSIDGGGEVVAGTYFSVGYANEALGEVTIHNGGGLETGTKNLANSINNNRLGNGSGIGKVLVTGIRSQWTTRDHINVGYSDTGIVTDQAKGMLTVNNRAYIYSPQITIAQGNSKLYTDLTGVLNIGGQVGFDETLSTPEQPGIFRPYSGPPLVISMGTANSRLNFNHTAEDVTPYLFEASIISGTASKAQVNFYAGTTVLNPLVVTGNTFEGTATIYDGARVVVDASQSSSVLSSKAKYVLRLGGRLDLNEYSQSIASLETDGQIDNIKANNTSTALSVNGLINLGSSSMLNVNIEDIDSSYSVIVSTNTVTLGGVLNLYDENLQFINFNSSEWKASDLKQGSAYYRLIYGQLGINNNFSNVTLNDLALEAYNSDEGLDFLRQALSTTILSSSGVSQDYVLSYESGLRWISDDNNYTGSFTLGAGQTFIVDEEDILDNQGFNSVNWDGQSLVKNGAGVLRFDASQHEGILKDIRVNEGELRWYLGADDASTSVVQTVTGDYAVSGGAITSLATAPTYLTVQGNFEVAGSLASFDLDNPYAESILGQRNTAQRGIFSVIAGNTSRPELIVEGRANVGGAYLSLSGVAVQTRAFSTVFRASELSGAVFTLIYAGQGFDTSINNGFFANSDYATSGIDYLTGGATEIAACTVSTCDASYWDSTNALAQLYNLKELALAWNDGGVDDVGTSPPTGGTYNSHKNGYFTLPQGNDFNVDVVLEDQLSESSVLTEFKSTWGTWDGKTLTKRGLGTLYLSAGNTYTGITNIYEGVLSLSQAENVWAGSEIYVGSTGVSPVTGVTYGAAILRFEAAPTDSQSLSDPGFASGLNTGHALTLANPIYVANRDDNSIEVVQADDVVSLTGALSNADSLQTAQTGLFKTGAGTLVLAGELDYSGDMTVQSGTLVLATNTDNMLGSLYIANGAHAVFDVGASGAWQAFSGNTPTMFKGNIIGDKNSYLDLFNSTVHTYARVQVGLISLSSDSVLQAESGSTIIGPIAGQTGSELNLVSGSRWVVTANSTLGAIVQSTTSTIDYGSPFNYGNPGRLVTTGNWLGEGSELLMYGWINHGVAEYDRLGIEQVLPSAPTTVNMIDYGGLGSVLGQGARVAPVYSTQGNDMDETAFVGTLSSGAYNYALKYDPDAKEFYYYLASVSPIINPTFLLYQSAQGALTRGATANAMGSLTNLSDYFNHDSGSCDLRQSFGSISGVDGQSRTQASTGKSDYRQTKLVVGGDLYASQWATGCMQVGGMWGYSALRSDVHDELSQLVGSIKTDTYNVGVYGRYRNHQGWSATLALSRYWNDVSLNELFQLPHSMDTQAWAVSGELAKSYALSPDLTMAPVLQAVYQVSSFDSVRNDYAWTRFDKQHSTFISAGVRTNYRYAEGVDISFKAYAWHQLSNELAIHTYGLGNGQYMNSLKDKRSQTWADLSLGITSTGPRWSNYATLGYTGDFSHDERAFSVKAGVRYFW